MNEYVIEFITDLLETHRATINDANRHQMMTGIPSDYRDSLVAIAQELTDLRQYLVNSENDLKEYDDGQPDDVKEHEDFCHDSDYFGSVHEVWGND